MAYLKTYNPKTRKPIKFVSRKARDRAVAKILRQQKRLLEGKTVVTFEPDSPYRGKQHGYVGTVGSFEV